MLENALPKGIAQKEYRKRAGMFALISLLVFMGVYSTMFIWAAFGLAALLIMEKDAAYALEMMFFLLPLSGVFKLAADQFSFFTLLKVLFIAKTFLATRTYSHAALGLLMVLSYLLLNGSNRQADRCIDMMLGFALCYFALAGHAAIRFERITQLFSLGIIFSALAAFCAIHTPLFAGLSDAISFAEVDGEEMQRFHGLYANSNYYTLDATMAFACYMSMYCGKKSLPVSAWGVIALMLGFGVLSASFSFLVSVMVIVGCCLLYLARRDAVGMLKGIAALLIVLAGVYFFIGENTRTALFYRFENQIAGSHSLSEITTGRSDLQKTYIDLILGDIKTFCIGTGIGSPYKGSGGRGPHNTYLDALYYLGIAGTLVYGFALGWLMKVKIKSKPKIYQWFPLVAFVVRAFAISLLMAENTYYFYILIGLSLSQNPKETKEIAKCKESDQHAGESPWRSMPKQEAFPASSYVKKAQKALNGGA